VSTPRPDAQVFGNMVHLTNMLRPQQARATLEYVLQVF
jgi:hypothetical protein